MGFRAVLNRHLDDSTLQFLQVFFKYLPPDGQTYLIEDLDQCADDNAIREHAASLDTGLLRPMLSVGGKSPVIISSPRIVLQQSIEDLDSFDIRLRRNCLSRDGYQCVLSGVWDRGSPCPPGRIRHDLVAAHIIPFSLGTFRTNDERSRLSEV
jgi:hypothetical protein